jgi:hypothetical protein
VKIAAVVTGGVVALAVVAAVFATTLKEDPQKPATGANPGSSVHATGAAPENPFPGFPTTEQTTAFVVQLAEGAYGPGTETQYLTCDYFAPGLGPPPLWDCSVRITISGQNIWYDELQITGHPDGTWECYDGSQTGLPLC